MENSLETPQKTESKTTYDLAFPLLGKYPKKIKTLLQKGAWTPMFIAALFTIASIWKQPRCPSTDEWIKMWYIYGRILLSHKKEWKVAICNNIMDLESIILSEMSDREGQKNQWI